MSEKKETESKATDEMSGNDCLKKSSGLADSKHIPFCNPSLLGFGFIGGRNVSLTINTRGNEITSYGLAGNIGGGGEPWEEGIKEETT
jgi:hypothetical protein